jgi:hypothetical protein
VVSGQLHALTALPRRNIPWYPFHRRLSEPQSQSGRRGENSWPYRDSNSDPLVRPTRSQSLYRLRYPGSVIHEMKGHPNSKFTNMRKTSAFTKFKVNGYRQNYELVHIETHWKNIGAHKRAAMYVIQYISNYILHLWFPQLDAILQKKSNLHSSKQRTAMKWRF